MRYSNIKQRNHGGNSIDFISHLPSCQQEQPPSLRLLPQLPPPVERGVDYFAGDFAAVGGARLGGSRFVRADHGFF